MIATTHNSAAPSSSAAATSDSHSVDLQEADTGFTGNEMPTEAELASALAELSPEVLTAPDESADAAPTEAEPTDSDTAADAVAAPEGEAAAAATTEDAAAASDATAVAPGETTEAAGSPTSDPTTNPKVSEGFQQRINELTAARRSAEEHVAQLSERIAAFEARDAGRLEPDVLETINDSVALEKQKTQWHQLHTWAARNLTNPEATLGERTYASEEVGAIFAQTSELLTQAAPRRAEFLAKRSHFDQLANQSWAWAQDQKSGYGAELHTLLTALPQLRTLPTGRLIAANAIVGESLRQAGVKIDDALIQRLKQEQARSKPAAPAGSRPGAAPAPASRRLPPSAPARPGTVPPRATGREAAKQTTLKRVNQGDGSEDAISASIAALL